MLADSKAVIMAVVSAGRIGKARTRALGALGTEIKWRKELYGREAVRIGWVKSHVGIPGNEQADAMAKLGTAKEYGGEIMEGGVRQRLRATKKEDRSDDCYLCVAGWDRHVVTTYSHLRTNKGNLQSWRYRIGKTDSPACRFCGLEEEETGELIMFECAHWSEWRVERRIEGTFRTWESWKDLGHDAWTEESGDGKEGVDLVRVFLSRIDLR